MSISSIAEGFYKNLLKLDDEISFERLKICRECKLYNKDGMFGAECNSKIYLNPTTNELSNTPKKGFYHGCGCVLKAKTRVRDEKCPLEKW